MKVKNVIIDFLLVIQIIGFQNESCILEPIIFCITNEISFIRLFPRTTSGLPMAHRPEGPWGMDDIGIDRFLDLMPRLDSDIKDCPRSKTNFNLKLVVLDLGLSLNVLSF